MTLIIHAINVHSGGGKSLLSALLAALRGDSEVVAQLDSRMSPPRGIPGLKIRAVAPSVAQRLKAEWWLSRNVKRDDLVICFGNLPPLFKLRGRTLVYLQNRYLIERASLRGFSSKARLRIRIERLWLSSRSAHADDFIVQTPSMKRALIASGYAAKARIHICPFAGESKGYPYQRAKHEVFDGPTAKRYDFVYVASGDPHKNHRTLVSAWSILAEQGIFPSLCLTVDKELYPELCGWLDAQTRRHGLKLENAGSLPHQRAIQLYSESRALIFPSRFEAIGLPLIEARQAGLAVLASELDYVRDIVDPEDSFDPTSALSIARSVRRFMRVTEEPLVLMSASEFLAFVLDGRPLSTR